MSTDNKIFLNKVHINMITFIVAKIYNNIKIDCTEKKCFDNLFLWFEKLTEPGSLLTSEKELEFDLPAQPEIKFLKKCLDFYKKSINLNYRKKIKLYSGKNRLERDKMLADLHAGYCKKIKIADEISKKISLSRLKGGLNS